MVYAIDLCPQMLEKLKEKYTDKSMTVVCGDYFRHPFGRNHFDVAVSFESFHHFAPVEKFRLYRKIWASLRKDGLFLLADYMVRSSAEEEKLRKEMPGCGRRKAGAKKTCCTAIFLLRSATKKNCCAKPVFAILRKCGMRGIPCCCRHKRASKMSHASGCL